MPSTVACAGLVAAVLIAAPLELLSQVCEGRPGHQVGAIQLNGSLSAATGAESKSFTASALGERRFGSLGIGYILYEELDGATFIFGGAYGKRTPLGESQNSEFCTIISGALGSGPSNIAGTGINASTGGADVALAFGRFVPVGNRGALIPTVNIGIGYSYLRLYDAVASETESDSYAFAGAGLGIVFLHRITIKPSVSLPLPIEGDDPSYGLSVSVSLPTRR